MVVSVTAVGIPEINPVLVVNDNPLGKEPEINLYETPPPFAETDLENDTNSVAVTINPIGVVHIGGDVGVNDLVFKSPKNVFPTT